LESKITEQGHFGRVIEVDVPQDELAPHFETAFRSYQKTLKLEGFRKGKVPLALVKKLYGDSIKSHALDEVVQSVFREVREKEDLRPVAPATLEDVSYDDETGLHFKASVEVLPEIELKKYEGLSVEKSIYQVDDEDVNAALSNIQEKLAVMEPVEGGAEMGHYLQVDFQAIDEGGVPLIGQKYEDRVVVLNDKKDAELSVQLVGVEVGGVKDAVMTTVNEDGSAGEDERFRVTVKEIKSKKCPELDDELAKDFGKFETLDELRKDIVEKLSMRANKDATNKMRSDLIEELLKENPFDLPASMINEYLDTIIENIKKQESERQFDEEKMREYYRVVAIRNLKWDLLRDKFQEMKNISVEKKDVEQRIAEIAEEHQIKQNEVRKALQKNKSSRHRFEMELLDDKVLGVLEETARIKEKKVTKKDLEKAKELAV